MTKITRSYKLQILPNFKKFEDVRYSASRYKIYLQHFITQLYYIIKPCPKVSMDLPPRKRKRGW